MLDKDDVTNGRDKYERKGNLRTTGRRISSKGSREELITTVGTGPKVLHAETQLRSIWTVANAPALSPVILHAQFP